MLAIRLQRLKNQMIRIIEKIKREEGDKAFMYKCPAGYWTVGAGINLERQEMPQEVRDLWLNIIIDRLNGDLMRACDLFHGDTENCDVDYVMFDMAYQMGIAGLMKFKKMLAAIAIEDYATAADELLNSKYAREDSPNRAKRNADILRGLE